MLNIAKLFNSLFGLGLIAIMLAICIIFTPAAFAVSALMPLASTSNITTKLVKETIQPFQISAVTLVDRFKVSEENLTAFLKRWETLGDYMKKQPGFLSAELKKDILSSQDWIMSEKWTSIQAYKQAVSSAEFQALIKDFPGKPNWFAQDLFPSL